MYANDEDIVVLKGITFAADENKCPVFKENAASSWNNQNAASVSIDNGNRNHLYECIDEHADQACYDLYKQASSATDGSVININQDMYCGNLTILYRGKNITFNGNGHTLKFKKLTGNIFRGFYYNDGLIVNDLNIVLEGLVDDNNEVFFDNCDTQGTLITVFDGTQTANNVTISTERYGTVTVKSNTRVAFEANRLILIE